MTVLGIHVTSNAKLVKKSLQDLGAEFPKIGRLQIYQVMTRSQKRLKQPGAKITYPVPWDSIKQKIKVIIILRYSLGLPYRRTGGYQKAYKIVKQDNGYELWNETNRAQYIAGDAEGRGQSRIHRGRYPVMRDVIDEEMDKLPTAVVAHIVVEAKKKGFEASGE